MAMDVVFFELRGRRCALPAAVVSEVAVLPNLTPVPHAPAGIRGVAPLHGQVLPVVDLGVWLGGGEPTAYRPGSDNLLLIEATLGEGSPVRAALVVERVMRLGTIDETRGRPPPPGPAFVTATVLDVEGPALLIDAGRAIDQIRDAVMAAVRG
jgi:purine-binding chemotaxis protein CheW